MNWAKWRHFPWVDTRANFVSRIPPGGRLLDLGTSDGSTLRHFAELRPDLELAAVDLKKPAALPARTQFAVVDLERGPLPWETGWFDGITCMHLIEHLNDATSLWAECARVLKPEGKLYLETPGPLSLGAKSPAGHAGASVTVNFYDDPTHIALVTVDKMRADAIGSGLRVERAGKSRNWIFVLAYPILRMFRPQSRNRYVAKLHWMGWSHFLIASKQAA